MRLKLAMGNRAKSLTVSPCYLSLINLTNEVTSAVNSGAFSTVGGGNLKSKLALSICTHAAEAEIGLFIIIKVVFPCSYPSVKFLSVGVQKVAKETDRPSKLGSAEQLQGTNCVRRSTSFLAFKCWRHFLPSQIQQSQSLESTTDYDYGKKKTVVDRHNNQQGVEIYYCPLKLHNPSFFPAVPYWIQLSMCRPLAKCREEADGLVTRACIAVSDS
ncbi:hypothetical protein T05_10481 [Trichinella murrelli]|uniref:Uncharacterized protein n=1 Tax=Trichinella murrelli TaxID=144512 RepID=A0A0V0TQ31_9BILA|nr:hypothetical protein T05_10481 [Trichinella murrelli]